MTQSQVLAKTLQEGIAAFEQKRYAESIALLTPLCEQEFPRSQQQVTACTILVQAHYACQQLEPAIELCTKLAAHPHPKVNRWGQQVLTKLRQRSERVKAAEAKNSTTKNSTIESIDNRASVSSSNSQTSEAPISAPQPTTTSESLSSQEIQQLLNQSKIAIRQKDYDVALERLDRYLAGVSSQSRSPQYWQAQTLLAQAYRGSGQMDEAVDLCEQLASQSNPETQQWAQQFLASIFASLEQAKQAAEQAAAEAEAEAQRLQAIEQARIEPRRVSELKQFYKKTLLPELKKVEKSRRSTLISVLIISAIFLAIFIYSATLTFQWPKIFFISSSIWLTLWIFFYSFRTSQYGFGFKRDVIQKLLEFMDSDGYLKYSPTGELGAARKALMKSTLLGELFPDIVHQDDYVSGTVGRTRLCFTDVCAEKSSITLLSLFKEGRGSEKTFWIASLVVVVFGFPYAFSRIARGRKLVFSEFWEHFYDSSISKRLLFKGLLYWSDFSKTFKSRTVIIPNKITERISKNGAINGLNRIKLEDPQFNKYFLVYGEDQVEARYILSTNLMHRIANLRKKLNRDICLSFVSYTMYITINYEEDLFEPKIFSSMLSFKPILEYFEIFQMAIAIVDDLRLNRRIWDAD